MRSGFFVRLLLGRVRNIHFHRNTNYALIVGGGRLRRPLNDLILGSFPEETELLDCKLIHERLTQSQKFLPENVKFLFGPGLQADEINNEKKYIKTIIDTQWINILLRKLRGEDNYKLHTNDDLPVVHGQNTYENIKRELISIINKAQKEDNIFLFFSGHGIKTHGVVLWNDGIYTKKILDYYDFNQFLTQQPIKAKIFLYVDSCFSGIYNKIWKSNIITFSSSSLHKVSYYTPGTSSRHIEKILESLSQNEPISFIRNHAIGALKANSYYASDNLTHHINQTFRKQFSPYQIFLEDKTHYYVAKIQSLPPCRFVARSPLAQTVLLMVALFYDPFSIIESILNIKTFVFLTKVGIASLKIILIIFSYNFYTKAENKIKQTQFYKEYPSRFDRIIVDKMENHITKKLITIIGIKNSALDFLTKNIEIVFYSFYQFRKVKCNDTMTPILSNYNYLFDKIILYFLDSIIKDRDIFELQSLINAIKDIMIIENEDDINQIYLTVRREVESIVSKENMLSDLKNINYKKPNYDFNFIFLSNLLIENYDFLKQTFQKESKINNEFMFFNPKFNAVDNQESKSLFKSFS